MTSWIAEPGRPAPWPRGTRAATVLCFLLALVAYGSTLCPAPYGDFDSTELVCCAAAGGLPHPGGYPVYHVLARAAVWLWPAEPARAVNALSALCGALTVGLLCLLLAALLKDPVVAAGGALLLGTCVGFWLLSVVAEVYTLHTALSALFLLLVTSWLDGGRPWTFLAACLVLGLALGNHATAAFLVPAGLLACFVARRWPSPGTFLAGAFLVCAVVLSAYLWYVPAVAASRNAGPWARHFGLGRKAPAARFFDYATGRIYRSAAWDHRCLPEGVVAALADLDQQLDALPLVPEGNGAFGAVARRVLPLLALAGLWIHYRGQPATATLLAVYAGATALFCAGLDRQTIPDADTMGLPVFLAAALWVAVAVKALVLAARAHGCPRLALATRLAFVAVVALRAGYAFSPCDLSRYTQSRAALDDMLQGLPPDSAVVADWLHASLLRYAQEVQHRRRRDLEVVPYGLATLAMGHVHGVPPDAVPTEWRRVVSLLQSTHQGGVYTTMVNVRALAGFPVEAVAGSRELHRLLPPPAPRFVPAPPPGALPMSLAADGVRLAACVPPPTTPWSPGDRLTFTLFWERSDSRLGDPVATVRVLAQDGTPLRVSPTEATTALQWNVAPAPDAAWPPAHFLVDERTLCLPPAGSATVLSPSTYALGIEVAGASAPATGPAVLFAFSATRPGTSTAP